MTSKTDAEKLREVLLKVRELRFTELRFVEDKIDSLLARYDPNGEVTEPKVESQGQGTSD